MIDRTIAQHTGAAEHVVDEHVVPRRRRRDPIVGRPEYGDDRHAERGREMHRTRVVRDEGVAAAEHPGEQPQVRAPGEIHDPHVARQA